VYVSDPTSSSVDFPLTHSFRDAFPNA